MHASSALPPARCLIDVAAFVLDYCAVYNEFELRLRSRGGGAVACCGACLADELGEDGIYDSCVPRFGLGVVIGRGGIESFVACLNMSVSPSLGEFRKVVHTSTVICFNFSYGSGGSAPGVAIFAQTPRPS